MNKGAEEGEPMGQKPTAMTFRQALLFVLYYAISQLMIVALAGPALQHFLGLNVTWKGLLSAFGLLACCGPVFVVLVYWFRASRDRPRVFAIRFGLSMCTMVMLYAFVVTLSARSLGMSFISPTALPGYFAVAAVLGLPIFSLTAYLLWRLRSDFSGRRSS